MAPTLIPSTSKKLYGTYMWWQKFAVVRKGLLDNIASTDTYFKWYYAYRLVNNVEYGLAAPLSNKLRADTTHTRTGVIGILSLGDAGIISATTSVYKCNTAGMPCKTYTPAGHGLLVKMVPGIIGLSERGILYYIISRKIISRDVVDVSHHRILYRSGNISNINGTPHKTTIHTF